MLYVDAKALPDELDDLPARTATQAYALALRAGLNVQAATAWAAWTVGLPLLVEERLLVWTMREVRHLLALRWAAEHGRL